MYFNVSQLMREPSGSSRTLEVDERLAPIDGGEAQRLEGAVKLLRTDKGIWVSGELDSQVLCACSRCLKEYWQPIYMTIEEESLPLADSETGVVAGLDDDEAGESFGIDQNQMLDLTEAVRQYSALSIPMKPVCDSDCKGICLNCGADLNETPCQCDNTVKSSLWGPLLIPVPQGESIESNKS